MAFTAKPLPPIEALRKTLKVDALGRIDRKTRFGWRRNRCRVAKYLMVYYADEWWMAHRLVFALVHGREPNGPIDHINGNKQDNRPENLREATPAQNQWNKTDTRKNGTGHRWVYRAGTGFQARLKVNHCFHVSPAFDDAELAGLVAGEMARRLHGEFAYGARP